MSILVCRVKSPLSQVTEERVKDYLSCVQDELKEELRLVEMDELDKVPFGLVYVASGGSEGIFLEKYLKLAERPLYILTSGESNSLAASMEILSYLQAHGHYGEIIHGSVKDVAARIRALKSAYQAKANLKGKKLGLIGDPSDWLIASPADDAAYRAKLGVSLEKIPMSELQDEIKKCGYPENRWTLDLKSKGYDAAEMEKALNVYGAFRRIVDRHGLFGLTVRCFDLLDSVHTTGCLGLAILNAEGIYGGCEGDVPSLMSMVILGEVSGNPVFLCNPSRINTEKGEMVLAHCTLPMNMPESYRLTTHYESGIGVAVAGHVPEVPCTIFKTNAALDRYFAKNGEIVGNLQEPTLCRTQIRLKLDDFSYFLTRPIYNHHLVTLGQHEKALAEFFHLIG